jgi:Protein tyrosine and serine/threonine kinase
MRPHTGLIQHAESVLSGRQRTTDGTSRCEIALATTGDTAVATWQIDPTRIGAIDIERGYRLAGDALVALGQITVGDVQWSVRADDASPDANVVSEDAHEPQTGSVLRGEWPAWPTLADRAWDGSCTAEEAARLIARIAMHCHKLAQAGLPQHILRPKEIHLDPAEGSTLVWLEQPLQSALADIAAVQAGAIDATERLSLDDLRRSSPEHLQHNIGCTDQSQQWTLGVLLFEAIAGALPFDGSTVDEISFAIFAATPTLVSANGAPLPEEIAAILNRCFEADPTRRFTNTAVLVAELASAAQTLERARARDRQTPTTPPASTRPDTESARASGATSTTLDAYAQIVDAQPPQSGLPSSSHVQVAEEQNTESPAVLPAAFKPSIRKVAKRAVEPVQAPAGAAGGTYAQVHVREKAEFFAALTPHAGTPAYSATTADAATVPPPNAREPALNAHQANTIRPVQAASAATAAPPAVRSHALQESALANADAGADYAGFEDEANAALVVERAVPPSQTLMALTTETPDVLKEPQSRMSPASTRQLPAPAAGQLPQPAPQHPGAQPAPPTLVATTAELVAQADPNAAVSRELVASFADGIGEALGAGRTRGVIVHLHGKHQVFQRNGDGKLEQSQVVGFTAGAALLGRRVK